MVLFILELFYRPIDPKFKKLYIAIPNKRLVCSCISILPITCIRTPLSRAHSYHAGSKRCTYSVLKYLSFFNKNKLNNNKYLRIEKVTITRWPSASSLLRETSYDLPAPIDLPPSVFGRWKLKTVAISSFESTIN
jgi:hypothetical protein